MAEHATDTRHVLTVACTEIEMEAIAELKRAAYLTSDADLVRTALWSFADHLDLDLPPTVFDLRPRQGGHPRGKRAPTTPPKPPTPKAAVRTAVKNAADHPWRLQEQASWAAHQANTDSHQTTLETRFEGVIDPHGCAVVTNLQEKD